MMMMMMMKSCCVFVLFSLVMSVTMASNVPPKYRDATTLNTTFGSAMGAGTPCLTALASIGVERIGHTVTLRIPYTACMTRGGRAGALKSNAALTASFRPRNAICYPVILTSASSTVNGSVQVSPAGIITFYPGPGCVNVFSAAGAVKVASAAENQAQILSYLMV